MADELLDMATEVKWLGEAVQGLTYPSETDAPLEAFSHRPSYLSQQQLACRLCGKLTDSKVSEMPLDEFLATLSSSNLDKYLMFDTPVRNLGDPKVYRIGEIQVSIILIGQCSDGWAGIKTLSVET